MLFTPLKLVLTESSSAESIKVLSAEETRQDSKPGFSCTFTIADSLIFDIASRNFTNSGRFCTLSSFLSAMAF